MIRITAILLTAALSWLLMSQCSKKKDGTVEIKIKAIDTVNLDGRWAGNVYTADNTTLGSFTLTLSESLRLDGIAHSKLDGTIKTPPLCKELENQGHTSVPSATIFGNRDWTTHDILIWANYTTTRFLNGNIVSGEEITWQFALDSLWVNDRGMQLTQNAVLEGVATPTKNCNTQGYRVKITKLP